MGITCGITHDINVHDYDVLVVGAGYAGAVCARKLAESKGYRVCILEQRPHIAGNAYDSYNQDGILIHNFGPHIYHTNSDRVHQFLSRFTEWLPYQHKVLANIHDVLMPVPFNHQSLLLAFGEERGERLYKKLIDAFGLNKKVPILELKKLGDPEITEVANYIYENVFLYYTMKQWGKTPDEIDPAVTGRVPVFIGDDDRYFPGAQYQGMPDKGYTELFKSMLNHDLIDVFLSVDAREYLTIEDKQIVVQGKPYLGEVIYTGPLDELFASDLGDLPYRTLDMKFQTLDMDEFQPVATVNYTTSEDFTRITEFKLMTGQVVSHKTTIMKEYSKSYEPRCGQTPYYAINNAQNQALYKAYHDRVSHLPNFHAVGRLAEYRYYDMDAVVLSALELCDEIIANESV